MIRMTHPKHGTTFAYSNVEEADNIKNGWTSDPKIKTEPVAELSELTDEEKLFAQYEAKFGKKPHHKMKLESIKEALED